MEQKQRVLVVDDNPSVHEDIRRILLGTAQPNQPRLAALAKELFGPPALAQNNPGAGVGYRIDDALQGEEAVAKVNTAAEQGDPYALVFMDVRMPPGMDGIQTIKAIWANHPHIQMVICTAYSDYSWDEILNELGISDKLLFLRKPFDAVGVKQVALTMTTKWALNQKVEAQVTNLESLIEERTRDLNLLLKEKEDFIRIFQDDLNLASSVQKFLLPGSLPQFAMLEVAAEYIPASKVGGDLYDVIQIDPKHILFLIFDVSGHGLAAALVTAICKYLLKSKVGSLSSPAAIFNELNNDLMMGTPETIFVSAFMLVIDTETLKAVYCSAGHPPPLLRRANTGELEELPGTGILLGISDNWNYEEKEIQLQLNDTLLLYTDGVIEAMNSENALFGRERLRDLLLKHAAAKPEGLLKQIIAAYKAWIGVAAERDDVCLLGFQIVKSRFAEIIQSILKDGEAITGLNYMRMHREPDIDQVCTHVLRELDRNGYDDKTIKGMRIALTEVLLNALHHGNRNDETKAISLAYHVNAARVIVSVLDEGAGFDYERLTLPENVDTVRGRGILISKHYVDSLTFHAPGNCVILIRYRQVPKQENA